MVDMALDYRYVVGRKKLRDSKRKRSNAGVKFNPVVVRVKATGAEGMAELMDGLSDFPPNRPVTISFGCHGQKTFMSNAIEVVK